MTMTDGWVGEQISTDPTQVGGLAATPQTDSSDPMPQAPSPERDKTRGSAGKWVGRAVLVAMLAVGGVVAWPYVADMLASEPVVVTEPAPQDHPTQRLVLDGETMYLEGSVPDEQASHDFEDVASAIVGSDRVVNNFLISDDAVFDVEQAVQLTVADTVLFPTGRADVDDQYEPLIDMAVEILDARELVTLEVIGHTDDVGDEETNLRLSIARAEATKEQIVARGVEPNRIATEGRGESEPLESNDTDEGRQTNRRVEFLVTGMLR